MQPNSFDGATKDSAVLFVAVLPANVIAGLLLDYGEAQTYEEALKMAEEIKTFYFGEEHAQEKRERRNAC